MYRYLSRLYPYIGWSVIILAASLVAGFGIAIASPETSAMLREGLSAMAEEILNRPAWEVAVLIFLNNSLTIFLMVLFGVLFSVIPVVFLFINGSIIGIVLYLHLATNAGVRFVAGVLPHGVIEIPALILGAAVGIHLGIEFIRRLRGVSERSVVREIYTALTFFFLVIIPLLAVAAVIEAYLTPLAINAVI